VNKSVHDETSHEALACYLRELHIAASCPSSRSIAKAVGVSHTQVNQYLRGTAAAAASWERLWVVVAHLGGDKAKARALWEQAQHRTINAYDPALMGLLADILAELRGLRKAMGGLDDTPQDEAED
jgi:hypothetical protein